jgi:hypothetical protein
MPETMSQLVRSVEYGGQNIVYELSFAAREDLQIRVHPDLRVTAVSPAGRSPEEVDARITARARWILKQRREFELLHPLPVPPRFVSGETHRFLGRQYRLRIVEGPCVVELTRPYLIAAVPDRSDTARIAQLLQSWYRARAKEVFPERLTHCMRAAPTVLRSAPRLQVRNMARRWGSCTSSGTITLNIDLVKASSSCIDYVIMHEICHLRVMNHGPDFYELLSRHMPDWKRRRNQLNAASH